jgi:hypothetical protein
MEDAFRAEFYDLSTRRANVALFTAGNAAPDLVDTIEERQKHFQGANSIRVERQFNDWLLASGGYLYSRLNGDGSFNFTEADLPEGADLARQLEHLGRELTPAWRELRRTILGPPHIDGR